MSLAKEQSPFEAMPLELHLNVLSHLSGPEDVLSTIHASPAALRALRTGREQIYAAVLQTRLAPEVFREFLAIANAPDHNTCPDVGPRQTDDEWANDRESILQEWTAWEQKAGDFLRSHALGAVYLPLSPKGNPTEFKNQTRLMIRLYFCVTRLISYYLPYAKSRPNGIRIDLAPTNQVAGEGLPFTDTELLRLQRGFLRYELCCRLIGIPSIASFCNTRVYDAVVAPHPTQPEAGLHFWGSDPFTRLLPLDEIEEVTCVSEFVLGLYNRLRCTFVEEFEEAILNFSHNEDVRGKEAISPQTKETVRTWLSPAVLSDNPFKGGYHPFRWSGNPGTRLGLAMLDRLIRSTPTDRRDFMRAAFHTFRRLSDGTLPFGTEDAFLRPSWNSVLRARGSIHQEAPLEVGAQCNAILKTCSTDLATRLLLCNKGPYGLRQQGWAFFDGQPELRSLDLPRDGSLSSIQDWVRNEARFPHIMYTMDLYESAAMDEEFTEHEWNQLLEKYAPKDLGGDFQAMSRFVADLRGVVDFRSDCVPQMH